MPGLGTGSSPSSCPNRSSSDWPVAHRPGRPAMSRTATRQAWPVRQPTVGPQPTPPGPSIKPPEPWRRSRPAGLASGEMVGYEGARGRAGREMSESATAGARSSRIPFGIIRNHEAVRPRRSRHLNHARDTPQMVAVAQVWREVVQATAIAIAPPLPVVSWGLISLAFLSHTVRGRYRRSPPAESGHHSNRRQAK